MQRISTFCINLSFEDSPVFWSRQKWKKKKSRQGIYMDYYKDKIYSLFFASEFRTGPWVIYMLNFHGDQWTVQSLSCVSLFATPWTSEGQASLSITDSWGLLKLMSINRWCHPTISSSVFPFSSCLQSFPAPGFSQRS